MARILKENKNQNKETPKVIKDTFVYVVTGLDYRAKESENIDERNITQYICRAFSNIKDAEKYIMEYFEKDATNNARLEIVRDKEGFIRAEIKDKCASNGVVYSTVFRLTTEEVTNELGEYRLCNDEHNPYCD